MAGTPQANQQTDSPSRMRARIEALSAGLLYGLITILAFPGVGAWPLAMFAPLPLIWIATRAADHNRSPLRTGLLAGLFTLPMWLFEHQWVAQMSALGLVPMGLVLSAYPALFVWALTRVRRRWSKRPVWLFAGSLWMAIEFLRGSLLFDGYPWLLAGHPLIEFAPLAMPARWFGTYFVSFLCVTVCTGILELFIGTRKQSLIVLLGTAVIWTAMALIPAGGGTDPNRTLTIGLVQTNVPQSVRGAWPIDSRVESMVELDRMTRAAGEQIGDRTPSLIVWPETMFPGRFLDAHSLDALASVSDAAAGFRQTELAFAQAAIDLERAVTPPLLVGVVANNGLSFQVIGDTIDWKSDARFNSALLLDNGRESARYDKIFLTPFGEVMPYISSWPWLEQTLLNFGAKGMLFDLAAGQAPVRFEIAPDVRVVTPICFEATMPGVCRRLVFEEQVRRAEVMINMTNDGWFGNSDTGRRLHLLNARWRCVELATPMARAANTGISCLIDIDGTVVHRMPVRERNYLIVEAPVSQGVPLFARIGHLVPWIALIGAILLLTTTYLRDQRGKTTDAERSETNQGDRS